MRHDWIFDVLRDLKTYAMANGFVALARKADEALDVARAEVRGNSGDVPPQDKAPPGAQSH